MNTRDQKRAQAAFERVNEVNTKEGSEFKKKYSTQCRRLPQLIQQCGLCQTVAFYQSKPKEAAMQQALKDFAKVVYQEMNQDQAAEQLAKKARTAEVREYQWLSRHSLQCATWMKRYAEALLPTESNE
jgi:CRISPR-associated protein Cmr5